MLGDKLFEPPDLGFRGGSIPPSYSILNTAPPTIEIDADWLKGVNNIFTMNRENNNEKECKTMLMEFNKIIEIEKNNLGDTRSADKIPNFHEFEAANRMHIDDVRRVMGELAGMVRKAGDDHDYTKTRFDAEFYRDFCAAMNENVQFVDTEWCKNHYKIERHHLNKRAPEDVNLIDVLEMISDCVCAGKARNDKFDPSTISIDAEVLNRAFENTVKLIDEGTKAIPRDKREAKRLADRSISNFAKDCD